MAVRSGYAVGVRFRKIDTSPDYLYICCSRKEGTGYVVACDLLYISTEECCRGSWSWSWSLRCKSHLVRFRSNLLSIRFCRRSVQAYIIRPQFCGNPIIVAMHTCMGRTNIAITETQRDKRGFPCIYLAGVGESPWNPYFLRVLLSGSLPYEVATTRLRI